MSMIYLASESPQRCAILHELGIAFTQLPMNVDEVTFDTPEETVSANAEMKVKAALSKINDGDIVIAADTVLFAGGHILGKPHSREKGREYLCLLSGNTVHAYSGVSVGRKGETEGVTGIETAKAQLRCLTSDEMDWYLETKEPFFRAGALGISRYGEIFVESVQGSHSCFAGLPKRMLLSLLTASPVVGSLVLPVPLPICLPSLPVKRFAL